MFDILSKSLFIILLNALFFMELNSKLSIWQNYQVSIFLCHFTIKVTITKNTQTNTILVLQKIKVAEKRLLLAVSAALFVDN